MLPVDAAWVKEGDIDEDASVGNVFVVSVGGEASKFANIHARMFHSLSCLV